MKLTMYGYPKCSTCRDAVKWLEKHGHEVTMHDLFEAAPPVKTLNGLIDKSGLPIQKFFNVNGEVYKESKLKDRMPNLSQEEKVALLAANGRLVKRPIVANGKRVTVGFKEAEYEAAWGKA